MATKKQLSDKTKSYKSRRRFQPSEFNGKTKDNARKFTSTFKNYCKLNNADTADATIKFEMCISRGAKCRKRL